MMAVAKKSQDSLPEDIAAQAMDPAFWRQLAPNFTVEGNIDPYVLEFTKDQEAELLAKMDKEAYVHVTQPKLKSSFDDMCDLLAVITDKGLPPVFAFAYDEFWMIHMQVRGLVKMLLGGEFSMLPDFWAWRVEPGQSGWKPHRDKTHGCLFPDGKPKSLTLWVPLSIVRPLNSCMYVLPADRDPNYHVEGTTGFSGRLPDLRALPADPGDVLVWTQKIFHWGSHSADRHDLPPRQSVAFEYQRSDIPAFNSPLLDPDTIPSFNARMALIAKQVLQYTHMYEFTPELEQTAQTILKRFGLPRPTGKSLSA
jgi:hypothetical protein